MKKTYIGTSWKMNKTLDEALTFCQTLRQYLSTADLPSHIQPFIIPPFTVVRDVSNYIKQHDMNCLTGVQNMHFADSGAFTGEISPVMVRDSGAYLVEMGHSERRALFGETDEAVNYKVKAALKQGLKPLICIGDTAQEKAWGVSVNVVTTQMKIALSGLTAQQVQQVIIAYEPVWAIGEHGIPASPQEAQFIHDQLRQTLIDTYGTACAMQVVLLYGGSVNQTNCSTLLAQNNIDGLFIGRSAWQADGFCNILSIISTIN